MDKVINFCSCFMFLDMQKTPLIGHSHNYYNWLIQIKLFPILNTRPQTFTKGRTHIPQWCPQQCSTLCVSGDVQVQEAFKVFLSIGVWKGYISEPWVQTNVVLVNGLGLTFCVSVEHNISSCKFVLCHVK